MKKFDAEKNIFWQTYRVFNLAIYRSVRVAERLALPTSDHGVAGSNPAGGKILPEPKRRFIAQSLSCSPFHRLEMTEILLKGRKTLTHPSIGHLQITVLVRVQTFTSFNTLQIFTSVNLFVFQYAGGIK